LPPLTFGLVVGGFLAPIDWRLVFLVSVPCGLFGTVWAYLRLRDISVRNRQPIDWLGNVTFAAGMILVMVGITHGIQPYGHSSMGWGSPTVISLLTIGALTLIAFAVVEKKVRFPMFRLALFRIKAFTFGTLSTFLSALGRGGLMFMMIIWLQGIWLPLHGYSFAATPLAAGVPAAAAARISALPPITILFATFLGYNPVGHLVGSKLLSQLPPASARALTGRSFFPNLISGPFHTGLHIAFAFSIACCLIAAVASWSRGSKYIAADEPAAGPVDHEPLFGEPADAGIAVASDDEDVEEVAGAEEVEAVAAAEPTGGARPGRK
jgi:hypothetical protein